MLLCVDVTTMLYNVSLCSSLIVYLKPSMVSGYVTLPDIVTLCNTFPHVGWLFVFSDISNDVVQILSTFSMTESGSVNDNLFIKILLQWI